MSDKLDKLTLEDLRAMSSEELEETLFKLSVILQESRFKNSINQLENTALLSSYRKKIAQINTLKNNKNLAKAA